MTSPKKKAALRGLSHNYAAVAAASAGTLLTLDAPTRIAQLGCGIYALTLTLMFTISATYHRPTWTIAGRSVMRKLDHCGIYLIIAGTYTPLCLLALDQAIGRKILLQVWTGTTFGILQALFSRGGAGSKGISAALYIALGWIVLPYSQQLNESLGPLAASLIVAGGVIYTLGAVNYALKYPDPWPEVFGYHELFHAAVILASILHFGAIRLIVAEEREKMCVAAALAAFA